MTTPARLSVVVYMLCLTVGLLAGDWPLEGPPLFATGTHGVHVGDLVVLAATAVASLIVLRGRR